MAAQVNPYLISLIAVGGTLFGALVAGGFQYLTTRRQLRWQAREAELKRLTELEKWAHAALEDRNKVLWSERKGAYARLIEAADEWMDANRDLASAELPKVQVGSASEASAASPHVAAYMTASRNFRAGLRDLELFGHETVVKLARELNVRLISSSRAALDGRNEREELERSKARMLSAMRFHMIEVHMPEQRSSGESTMKDAASGGSASAGGR
ncbi:hypothetical protein AB0M35_07070 [Micromonospora sp. NPDC051196]|uniref:hypothetical protein n=1 Tax=Micromonospora sp. NPDC051196 TaxID=3155281 RepID=UPI003437F90E